VGDRDQVGLEARGAAGLHDQPLGVGHGPVLVAQVLQRQALAAGQAVVEAHGDHEPLAEEVAPLHLRRLDAGVRGVLEVDRQIEFAAPQRRDQLLRAALVDADVEAGLQLADARDRLGHEAGQRGRERPDPQPRPPPRDGAGKLGGGQLEARGDRVGVAEQDLSLARQPQAARLALEQAGPDLLLERGDLRRDRRLGEREGSGRAGERPLMRDGAEGEHPARIHSFRLSHSKNDNLPLCALERRLNPMFIAFAEVHNIMLRAVTGALSTDRRRRDRS
jgi:hypothetical protein